MRMPESMDECFYFTRRTIGDKGKAVAWVFKPDCPECGKDKMGKPIDPKTGKVKVRSKEYTCPACDYTVPKDEFDSTLTLHVKYTCPHCGQEGETDTEYKRKSFKGVKAYVFKCDSCGEKIGITKKMKEPKR